MDLAQIAKDIAEAYVPPDVGRPAEIANPDTIQAFLGYIEDGNYPEVAAELSDISLSTYRSYMQRGERGETPFDLFARAVKRAAAKAEAVEVGKVRKAGELPQYWTASMTYLERRHPDRWSRRTEPQEANRTIINIGLSSHKIQIQATTDSHLEASHPDLLTSESES
jgi:hypothetical protein